MALEGHTLDLLYEIIVPDRFDGIGLQTNDGVIHPDYPIGYMTVCGQGGSHIYIFPALAPSQVLFSHQ